MSTASSMFMSGSVTPSFTVVSHFVLMLLPKSDMWFSKLVDISLSITRPKAIMTSLNAAALPELPRR